MMQTLAANTVAISPPLAPVVQQWQRVKLHGSDVSGVHLLKSCNARKGQHLLAVKSGRSGFCTKPTLSSSCVRSASFICASALAATCAAEQTQTVTKKAPTITHLPGKQKSPQLDDGGSGFPPRDDGGGGGGGGGGGNWSGGFFLFCFLAFLGFLKDKESEESYRDDRR